ncbi:MAG: hypothetical protein ACREU1_08110 [Burkholderiales bacterium]
MMRLLGLNIITVVLAAVLGQPPALAQTTAKDVSKKTAEAWDTLKSYTVDKKNDAVGYGRKLVRDTDRKIKELEGKAAKASGEVKAQYDREIKDLKARRAKASKKLDEMGKATGAAWDSAKDGFADAYRELHEAYDKAAAKFK